MSAQASDGWPGTIINDRRMIDFEDEIAPAGKKWECCAACQGKGKVLVDDIIPVIRPESTPLSDGLKRFSFLNLDGGVNWGNSPIEKSRKGNNPFGPRGTLRCLACQRRKKRVCITDLRCSGC
jgi:hypothetical protein